MKKILMALFLITSSFLLSACDSGRNGSHTGYITAVQNEGLIFHKDYIFIKTDKSSSQEDKYCINPWNKELSEAARGYEITGQKVTLKYNTHIQFLDINHCSDDYLIDINQNEI